MLRGNTVVIDDVRVEPKYRPLLRPIGAFLDTLRLSHLILAESEEGFIWRGHAWDDLGGVLYGVMPHADVPALAESFKQARLGRIDELNEPPVSPGVCPQGYEELLRCIGEKLDLEAATSVMVIEDDDMLLVQFTLPVPTYVQMEPERLFPAKYFHEVIYSREDIAALIASRRRFRGSRYYR
jgi:hypothetical protein